ncbi:TPA: hypothetical protein ACH3X1_015204 [Trebouxia sp. C0004]
MESSRFQVQLLIVQIVFSGVFLLTPGKEAYRLKAHEDEDEVPILSSPRANSSVDVQTEETPPFPQSHQDSRAEL